MERNLKRLDIRRRVVSSSILANSSFLVLLFALSADTSLVTSTSKPATPTSQAPLRAATGGPERGTAGASMSATTTTTTTTTTTREPMAVESQGQARAKKPISGHAAGREITRWRQYKLPNWFDYDLYRRFHEKRRPSNGALHELHKRIYLRTALRVFEKRAKYRAGRATALASVNEFSDLTAIELAALKGRKRHLDSEASSRLEAEAAGAANECCTYEQVYEAIIGLLNRTMAADGQAPDTALSRAYIEELEQKPLSEASSSSDSIVEVSESATMGATSTGARWTDAPEASADFSRGAGPTARGGVAPGGTVRQVFEGGSREDKKETEAATPASQRPTQVARLRTTRGQEQQSFEEPKKAKASGSEKPALSATPRPEEGGRGEKSEAQKAWEAAVDRQVKEALGPDSENGRFLAREYSAYFGQPVVVEASFDSERARGLQA